MKPLVKILLIMALLVAQSCEIGYHGADIPEDNRPEQSYVFSFDLQLPELTTSRAPAGSYDPGLAEWENYIDIVDDLKFYFFDGNKQFLGTIDQLGWLLISPQTKELGSDYKRYRVSVKVARDIQSEISKPGFRIVVLANCGPDNYPAVAADGSISKNGQPITTLDQLYDAMTYELSTPPVELSADRLIPMFGIKEFDSGIHIDSSSDTATSIGTIHLLRAMAKIDVMVSDEEVNDLKEVKLHGYNTVGYCTPKVYTQGEYVKGSWATDYASEVNIPAQSGSAARVADFGCSTIESNGVQRRIFTIYVPEYRNIVGGIEQDDRSYMTLKFDSETDPREFRLEFKDYSSTSEHPYFDLHRNNYYRYTVKRNDAYLEVIAEVHPYEVVPLNPDFGIVTGEPIWESVFSIKDVWLDLNDLSMLYFDWTKVLAAMQEAPASDMYLNIFLLSRAPVDHPEYCEIRLKGYNGAEIIAGTQSTYVNPANGKLSIQLTQAMVNDIIAKGGLTLRGRYLILYRITLSKYQQ